MTAIAYLVMGVAGCGKSTIARAVADAYDCAFIDADDLHPPANIDKMRQGIALNDADRWPWLTAVAQAMSDSLLAGRGVVMACSALKQAYRDAIAKQVSYRLIYIDISPELCQQRLAAREHAYFDPALCASQFEALEVPAEAVVVDAAQALDQAVHSLLERLK